MQMTLGKPVLVVSIRVPELPIETLAGHDAPYIVTVADPGSRYRVRRAAAPFADLLRFSGLRYLEIDLGFGTDDVLSRSLSVRINNSHVDFVGALHGLAAGRFSGADSWVLEKVVPTFSLMFGALRRC